MACVFITVHPFPGIFGIKLKSYAGPEFAPCCLEGAIIVARKHKKSIAAKPAAQKRVLLPKNVRPTHYALYLTPNADDFTFDGSVVISLDVVKATDRVQLHARDLTINEAHLITGKAEIKPREINHDEDAQVLSLIFAAPLPPGEATLKISFRGVLNDAMAGFYRSKFTAPDKSTRHMFVTQFEPCDARRAFPCWDEPEVKATFDVALTVPEGQTALSNMPIISEVPGEKAGTKVVRYATTPVMSTYLVAFAVGDLEYVEGVSRATEGIAGSKDKIVRVYTTPGEKEKGRFALDCAVRTLTYFERYFGIAYPLPKLDMLAVPDFSAGAMENWGLVTYRITALLYEEGVSPGALKQRVAEVVAHELAHQWFGNIVTMEWWTHLWLNEGFATWVGTLAVDHLFPEWKVWDQFIVNDIQPALDLDGLKSSHPIEVEIYNSFQVDEIFDAISYCKGASIIRVLVNWIGVDAFRSGLKSYLEEHSYKNAGTDDLWRALGKSSGKPVETVMGAWTRMTGYPVVSVSRDAEDPKRLVVSQKRYLAAGPAAAASDKTAWSIPLVFQTADGKITTGMVTEADSIVDLGVPLKPWVKVNAGYYGFYRTLYSPELFNDLLPVLPTLPAADRMNLANDYFAFSEAGYIRTSQALSLVAQCKSETDYTVWKNLASYLGSLQHAWSDQPEADQERLRELRRSLFVPLAIKLGWEKEPGESHLTTLLRQMILGQAGKLGDERIVAEARNRFRKLVAGDDKAVSSDLKSAVFGTTMMNGGAEEFEQLVTLYERMEAQDQKVMALQQLAQGPTPALVQLALEYAMTEKVRAQDFFYVLASAASNRFGRPTMWDWVKSNWGHLTKKFSGGFLLTRVVTISIEAFASEERAREAEAFFAAHPQQGLDMSIKQALEKVRTAAAWGTRDRADVAAWFEAKG